MANRIVIANRVHSSVVQRLQAYGDLVLNETEFPLSAEELAAVLWRERSDGLYDGTCRRRVPLGLSSFEDPRRRAQGYNNFDVDACTRRNICVTVVPDLLTEPTAELTVGLIIAILRNFGPGDATSARGSFTAGDRRSTGRH